MKKTLLISLFTCSINLLSSELPAANAAVETITSVEETKESKEQLIAALSKLLIDSVENFEQCSHENESEICALFNELQKDFTTAEINEMLAAYNAL